MKLKYKHLFTLLTRINFIVVEFPKVFYEIYVTTVNRVKRLHKHISKYNALIYFDL
jgi:hypothetical protein